MKKLLIFALCLLGICNARAEMMTAQEIILTETATMQPWDNQDDDKIVLPHDGNSVRAFIQENELYISTDMDAPAYVEVIDATLADSEEKTQMEAGIGTGYHSASLWEIEEQQP